MAKWYEVYNDMFFIALVGAFAGIIGICVRAAIKCKFVECDGCGIHIRRNPDDDEQPETDTNDVIPSPTSLITRKTSNSLSNRNMV